MTIDYNDVLLSNSSWDYIETKINGLLEEIEIDPLFDNSSEEKYTCLHSTEVKIVLDKVHSKVINTFIFGCPRLDFILHSFLFILLKVVSQHLTGSSSSVREDEFKKRNRAVTIYDRDKIIKNIKNSIEELKGRVNTSACEGMCCVIKIKTIEPSKHLFGWYGDIKNFETEEIYLNNI